MYSELFRKTCLDTRTAWSRTNLSQMMRAEKVSALRSTLESGSARDIAELLMQMSYSPYGGASANLGFDDGKANRLSGLLMTALLQSFVDGRTDANPLDLNKVLEGVVHWIDTGKLGHGVQNSNDLQRITCLIEKPEVRVTLTAPFAAPIEFSILALEGAEVAEGEMNV